MSSGLASDFPRKSKLEDTRSSISSLDKKATRVESSSIRNDDLIDGEPKPFRFTDWLLRRKQPLDLDSIATRRAIYDDPDLGKYYWPKADYENIHRFNPNARWTWREERALVRKVDWKVMLWGK
ncbi:hypothetical protein C0992_003251 [Termitomyces sp. T32_za158]|nr:hypothetical protein C0992_003251 [Termitomyces sp. T32_za158]